MHCSNCFGIRAQRLEWQRLVMRNPREEQAHGVRHGQPHRGKHSRGLFLDGTIDAGLDESICSRVLQHDAVGVGLQGIKEGQPDLSVGMIGNIHVLPLSCNHHCVILILIYFIREFGRLVRISKQFRFATGECK